MRVDAIIESVSPSLPWLDGTVYFAYDPKLGWLRLPASRFLYECNSPEQAEAIRAKRDAENKAYVIGMRREYDEKQRHAPPATRPGTEYGKINRQGTRFSAGDFGITRE